MAVLRELRGYPQRIGADDPQIGRDVARAHRQHRLRLRMQRLLSVPAPVPKPEAKRENGHEGGRDD